MVIVFITNNYTPYSGGVKNSIQTSVNELHKSGHDIFIITLDFFGDYNDPSNVLRIPCPIKFRYKKNYMAIPWRAYNYIDKWIKELNPDIIHVHHPFLLGKIGLKVALKHNIPIIFTYHTMYEYYAHYIPFFPDCITKPIIKKLVLTFCKNINGIIAPSSFIEGCLRGIDVQTPVAVIPSGLRKEFLEIPIQNKKRKKTFQLLTVSRFTKEKNIPFLLDVFAQLPEDFCFTLVGYGSECKQLELYAYKTLGLSRDRLQFISKPNKADLLQLYQQANLFLFSSQTDTQGLVLAESMACATPVIALNGPGQRDIVQNEYNGFLVQNQHEMEVRIRQIAQDVNLHKQLCKNALKTAQNYHAEHVTKQLISFYHQIRESYQLG